VVFITFIFNNTQHLTLLVFLIIGYALRIPKVGGKKRESLSLNAVNNDIASNCAGKDTKHHSPSSSAKRWEVRNQ
jgi:hypothetical protein